MWKKVKQKGPAVLPFTSYRRGIIYVKNSYKK